MNQATNKLDKRQLSRGLPPVGKWSIFDILSGYHSERRGLNICFLSFLFT